MSIEIGKPTLAKADYQHFIGLYQQVKQDGLESKTFNQLLRDMYQAELIAPFDYTDWQTARAAWNNPAYHFEALNLFELQQHLNAIFYADRFEEGTVVSAFNSGLFEKIFSSMEQKIALLQN
jgi:hypothetical protein